MGGGFPPGTGSRGAAGNASSDDASAPVAPAALAAKFDIRRRSVSDPARLAAAELQNISEILLEILKVMRKDS
jgi:hypothetical protein